MKPERGEQFNRGSTRRGESAPGCVYRHAKTGGYYWKVFSSLVPEKFRGQGRWSYVPLRAGRGRHATKSRQVAEAVRRRLWQAWRAGRLETSPGMDRWLHEFREWNRDRGNSPRQTRHNVNTVARFIAAAALSTPQGLQTADVTAYLRSLREAGRAAQTVLNAMHAISAFCGMLVRRGELAENPVAQVERPRRVRRPPRFLTDDQIVRTLVHVEAGAPFWLWCAVCLALYEGLRVGEIPHLRRQDVHDGHLIVGGGRPTKTGGWRSVPLFPECRPVLRWCDTEGPMLLPYRHADTYIHSLADATASLPWFGDQAGGRTGNRWHLLRSTFAVQRARGVGLADPASPWQLMAWLGHSTMQTTLRYVHVARAAVPR